MGEVPTNLLMWQQLVDVFCRRPGFDTNGSPDMTSLCKKLMRTRKAPYKLSDSLNIKVPFKLIIKPFKNKDVECI